MRFLILCLFAVLPVLAESTPSQPPPEAPAEASANAAADGQEPGTPPGPAGALKITTRSGVLWGAGTTAEDCKVAGCLLPLPRQYITGVELGVLAGPYKPYLRRAEVETLSEDERAWRLRMTEAGKKLNEAIANANKAKDEVRMAAKAVESVLKEMQELAELERKNQRQYGMNQAATRSDIEIKDKDGKVIDRKSPKQLALEKKLKEARARSSTAAATDQKREGELAQRISELSTIWAEAKTSK